MSRAASRLFGRVADRESALGFALGTIGMIAFSFTLPATKLAVRSTDAVLVGLGRALLAMPLAATALWLLGAGLPPRSRVGRLGLVMLGVVFGFPLFTALALHHVSSAHGAVVVGLLPIATAAVAVIRGGERPSAAFWSFALAGALTITLFAALESGTNDLRAGNAFALLAVILGGLGYAEGGALAREFGGTRVIAWTLVLASPLVAPIVVGLVVADGLPSGGDTWLSLAYLASVSAFLGFIPWYSGLARGGIARVGQVQLLQPLLTLLWSAWLLDEHLSAVTAVTAVVVIACIAGSTRSRIHSVRSRACDGNEPIDRQDVVGREDWHRH